MLERSLQCLYCSCEMLPVISIRLKRTLEGSKHVALGGGLGLRSKTGLKGFQRIDQFPLLPPTYCGKFLVTLVEHCDSLPWVHGALCMPLPLTQPVSVYDAQEAVLADADDHSVAQMNGQTLVLLAVDLHRALINETTSFA